MRSADTQLTVRPLVEDLMFTSQATDAIHTPSWAIPTNCFPVFLTIGMTFASL